MRELLHQFDKMVTYHIQHWGAWVEPLMVSVSFVGKPVFTIAICVAVAAIGGLLQHMRLVYAGGVALAVIGLGLMFKLLLGRDRPITDYVLNMRLETPSFPSGHTVGSTVAYGLLAYLLFELLPSPWNYAAAVILIVLIIAVGISRIYLGAHFPSDVVAGWLLGAAGLAIIIIIIKPNLSL